MDILVVRLRRHWSLQRPEASRATVTCLTWRIGVFLRWTWCVYFRNQNSRASIYSYPKLSKYVFLVSKQAGKMFDFGTAICTSSQLRELGVDQNSILKRTSSSTKMRFSFTIFGQLKFCSLKHSQFWRSFPKLHFHAFSLSSSLPELSRIEGILSPTREITNLRVYD